jgi:hypothetical protein
MGYDGEEGLANGLNHCSGERGRVHLGEESCELGR